MTHALLLRSTPMRPLHPLVLAASLLLCAAPLAAQAQTEPAAADSAATAEPSTTPSPQLPLTLAAQLSPGSLAGDSARKQLLTALYTMLSEHPDVRKSRAALESAGHDVHTAQGERWPKF